jgi:hypothetical protein
LFFVQHIDSVIQLLVGAFVTWFAFRRSSKLGARTRTILRVCGPALIVVAGVLLLKPDPAPTWERQLTTDKVASAEFPAVPSPKETTDTVGTVTVKRTSFTYDVPGKDIALALSYSALPENTRALTDAQRIEGTLAYLASQGSKVLHDEKGPTGSIHRITVRQDDKKVTVQMAIAYVGDNAYRVVASWTDGQEDKALTDRFVNSFRLSVAQASPSR